MASFEIETADRQRAERLSEFMQRELGNMTVEARFAFTMMMIRYLDPEIKELKRKATEGKANP